MKYAYIENITINIKIGIVKYRDNGELTLITLEILYSIIFARYINVAITNKIIGDVKMPIKISFFVIVSTVSFFSRILI